MTNEPHTTDTLLPVNYCKIHANNSSDIRDQTVRRFMAS